MPGKKRSALLVNQPRCSLRCLAQFSGRCLSLSQTVWSPIKNIRIAASPLAATVHQKHTGQSSLWTINPAKVGPATEAIM